MSDLAADRLRVIPAARRPAPSGAAWPSAIAVATILASWIALPTVALADGMLVWGGRQVDIVEPTQKAFILFDHGAEDLVLEVRFAGAPREFVNVQTVWVS